jgi:hypothetical protein
MDGGPECYGELHQCSERRVALSGFQGCNLRLGQSRFLGQALLRPVPLLASEEDLLRKEVPLVDLLKLYVLTQRLSRTPLGGVFHGFFPVSCSYRPKTSTRTRFGNLLSFL